MTNISIIGGDRRNSILSELLEKNGFCIHTYGVESKNSSSFQECVSKSKYIVTAMPFSNDGVNIYAPTTGQSIRIQEFTESSKNKVIIGGKFSDSQVAEFEKSGNIVIDLMKDEELAQKNVIPTVEGIVKIIIENTDVTIDASNIAVLGFGRIGKRLSKILKMMGANVYCVDNKKEEVANIELSGYNVIENICADEVFDVVINTVPKMIIGEKELTKLGKDTLIIDVASKPGGVDYKYANKNNYRVIQALGIPGKIAPVTAAKYIQEIVKKVIIEV